MRVAIQKHNQQSSVNKPKQPDTGALKSPKSGQIYTPAETYRGFWLCLSLSLSLSRSRSEIKPPNLSPRISPPFLSAAGKSHAGSGFVPPFSPPQHILPAAAAAAGPAGPAGHGRARGRHTAPHVARQDAQHTAPPERRSTGDHRRFSRCIDRPLTLAEKGASPSLNPFMQELLDVVLFFSSNYLKKNLWR